MHMHHAGMANFGKTDGPKEEAMQDLRQVAGYGGTLHINYSKLNSINCQ